jgi:glycosyltransferase involved in cell wall biosynthesis
MKNLNVMAPINSLGYGVASLNTLINLRNFFDIALFPIGNNQEVAQIFPQEVARSPMFDADAPCLKIWHEFDMSVRVGKGDLIAFPFFEVDEFNDQKKHHLAQCEKVITSCQWAADIVRKEVADSNVFVAPLGVDRTVFYNNRESQPTEKFILFNCGKWEVRKGHDVMLEIFQRAFPDNTDVELWMMCQNPVANPEYNQKWNNYYMQDPRVRLLNRCNTHKELSDIMRSVSCGFFPSRAEGWNLELLEMMSCGKPVVTTDYSAHTEFCTDENSYKVKPKSLEKAFDGMYFREEDKGNWASLKGIENDLVEAIREVYEQWKKDGDVVNKEGIKTAQNMSWAVTANKVKEAINA